ncbi:MAG: DUF1622 domain-containing protein [Planctomycetaceae bacterium]
MRDDFKQIVEGVGLTADAVGVLVIVLGLLIASVQFLVSCWRATDAYRQLRMAMGRTILLGLEFLVAADIIRTVAVDPTLETVIVLGLIVVIRTFLSMAIEVELEGIWPWQRSRLSAAENKPVETTPKDDRPN